MTILTVKQIDQKVSLLVSKYISKGYVLVTQSLHDYIYSNEICHIDLTSNKKSNKIIRISMYRNRDISVKRNDKTYYFSTIEINVVELNKHKNSTYYDNGATIRDTEVFYSIKRDKCYTDSLDEAIAIFEMRELRKSNKNNKVNLKRNIPLDKISDSFKDKIIERIKRNPGAKRASRWDCIKSVILKSDTSIFYRRRLVCEIKWEYKNHSGYIYL